MPRTVLDVTVIFGVVTTDIVFDTTKNVHTSAGFCAAQLP